MKIILAGTPTFAVKAFENVINQFDVVGIITQPDKPKNRGQKIVESPVKELATKYQIPLFQPKKIQEIEKELSNLEFDIFLTCAYGQIIPESILKIAKKCSLNIHASLLPKYRGAAPIHYSILNGDKKTGVSLMYMINEMDAGDVLFQVETPIEEHYTTGQMFEILSIISADHINEWLKKVETNYFEAKPQENAKISFAPKIIKEDCEIKTTDTIQQAKRKIRAFNPFPGAYVIKNNTKYKVYNFGLEGIEFQLSDGSLFITEIKAPNKKTLYYKDFLKGNKF